ncbi:hypothetical protein BDW62DRAFT_194304 [Aspergillus aurantiobrunneus]
MTPAVAQLTCIPVNSAKPTHQCHSAAGHVLQPFGCFPQESPAVPLLWLLVLMCRTIDDSATRGNHGDLTLP